MARKILLQDLPLAIEQLLKAKNSGAEILTMSNKI